MYKKILCMTALAAVVAPAFAAEWMTDFEAAKAKAAQENKAILVDFTGSDWCGYCIKLRKEVLDTPAFEQYAEGKFVLMEVDVPNSKPQPAELKEQNAKLCAQYKVKGFPTLLVLTPEGKVMGGFSGYRPTLEKATEPLDAALATIELYKKAQTASGDDKVQQLMEIYQSLPESMRTASGLIHEVAAADANNLTGAKEIAQDELQAQEIQEKLVACGNDTAKAKAVILEYLPIATPGNKPKLERTLQKITEDETAQNMDEAFRKEGPAAAVARINEMLPGTTGELKLKLHNARLKYMLLAAETLEDVEAAKKAAAEMRVILPAHMVNAFDDFVQKTFADPEALLREAEKQRDAMKK